MGRKQRDYSSLFPRTHNPVFEAHSLLQEAYDRFRPSHVFGLLSGGHDSLCATHIASSFPFFSGAVHINTQVGVEETRQFVRDACARYGWLLLEYTPPPWVPVYGCRPCQKSPSAECPKCGGSGKVDQRKPGIDYDSLTAYESLVLHYGFPGAFGHSMVYRYLKERCVRKLVADHKAGDGDHIFLVSGVRKEESSRRMGYVEAVRKEGARVWVAPIVDWDGLDKREYIQANRLPKNEVVQRLCMSGECLCGAFAGPDEITDLEKFYPAAAAYLHSLEEKVRARGERACVWGQDYPAPPSEEEDDMPLFGLCFSCPSRRERARGADA